ncbi:hypothetical protein BC831DRAFT_448515, partial [Entophlyctis helioformis]
LARKVLVVVEIVKAQSAAYRRAAVRHRAWLGLTLRTVEAIHTECLQQFCPLMSTSVLAALV